MSDAWPPAGGFLNGGDELAIARANREARERAGGEELEDTLELEHLTGPIIAGEDIPAGAAVELDDGFTPHERAIAAAHDDHMPAPGERFAFDEHVTERFEDMLARSIPEYETMRGIATDVARRYAQRAHSTVLDLGCSKGGAIESVRHACGPAANFIGAEVSVPMLYAAQARFELDPAVSLVRHDLRTGHPLCADGPCGTGFVAGEHAAIVDVTLAILTLQFTPIEYRQRIVRDVYEHTRPGGAFLLVEKVLGAGAELDRFMVDTYYDLKRDHGYPEEAVQRKREALEGVLVPMTARANEDLLREAGFRHVDCVWRWHNFAGWLAVRDRGGA